MGAVGLVWAARGVLVLFLVDEDEAPGVLGETDVGEGPDEAGEGGVGVEGRRVSAGVCGEEADAGEGGGVGGGRGADGERHHACALCVRGRSGRVASCRVRRSDADDGGGSR